MCFEKKDIEIDWEANGTNEWAEVQLFEIQRSQNM